MDQRERFEAVFSSNGRFPDAIERDGETYRLGYAKTAWYWWKAAISSIDQPATPKPISDKAEREIDSVQQAILPAAPVERGGE
jgi:hypothetical protein